MARSMGHSDAINFTEVQPNFRSINAQMEIKLLIDETKFSINKGAYRQENRWMQIELVELEKWISNEFN